MSKMAKCKLEPCPFCRIYNDPDGILPPMKRVDALEAQLRAFAGAEQPAEPETESPFLASLRRRLNRLAQRVEALESSIHKPAEQPKATVEEVERALFCGMAGETSAVTVPEEILHTLARRAARVCMRMKEEGRL